LLTSGTLQAWLAARPQPQDHRRATLVGLPYAFKFLWAPLVDRILAALARATSRLDPAHAARARRVIAATPHLDPRTEIQTC
jgi:hypothetical protein